MAAWPGSDHHPPCPGGCGELADECMTPGCGNPLGAMRITAPIGSRPTGDDLPYSTEEACS